MKKFKRQSIIVWVLVFILGVSTVAVPIFGGLDLAREASEDIDIMAFKNLCK